MRIYRYKNTDNQITNTLTCIMLTQAGRLETTTLMHTRTKWEGLNPKCRKMFYDIKG